MTVRSLVYSIEVPLGSPFLVSRAVRGDLKRFDLLLNAVNRCLYSGILNLLLKPVLGIKGNIII